MPKTSVDKNYPSSRFEDEVRRPRQSAIVKSISKTQPVNETADEHLGLGVATADSRHTFASFLVA